MADSSMPASRHGTEIRQRTHLVGVRLKPAEMELLKAQSERLQMTKAATLRRAFLASVPAKEGDS